MNTPPLEAIYFHDFGNSYIPHILKEVYIDQVYAPFVKDKKDLTVLDCGANVGLTAYYFKDYAKQVIAVEPSKIHQEALSAMVKQNSIKNIVLFPNAIAGECGMVKLNHNPNVTMFSMRQEVASGEFEEVEAIDMVELFKRAKIDHVDIMKMDIEGSEYDLITSESFQKMAPKIDCILGEFHTWSGVNPAQFANCLSDLGYKFEWMNKTEASTFSAVRIWKTL